MPSSRQPPRPPASVGSWLGKLFGRDEPTDEAARAALDHIDQVHQQIESVRKEVKRGVRSSDKRFRL